MKIDTNKKYKTELEELETIVHTTSGPNPDYPVVASIKTENGWRSYDFTEKGKFACQYTGHPLDLIEVKEKKQLTGFVNVYKSNLSTHHRTKELADDYAKAIEIRIACIDLSQYGIFYEENEGL